MTTPAPHEGRNLKRIREIMGIKQEALAMTLGHDWNQQKVSLLEQKEQLDPKILEEVAAALHVKPEAIRNFDEEKAVYNIQNNYEGSHNLGAYNAGELTINNPVEKWIEALEENKKLYERLLATEREKVALLEKLVNGK
jgi:transcriptional regulator with XRE-family HTH domain